MACFALFLLVTASVVLRYFFNRPIVFTEDVTGYLMVMLVFMGLAYTLKEKAHILVEVVVERLKPTAKWWLMVVTTVIGLAWAGGLLLGSWSVWWRDFTEHTVGYSGLRPLLWPLSLPLLVGSALLFLQVVAELLELARRSPGGREPGEAKEQPDRSGQ